MLRPRTVAGSQKSPSRPALAGTALRAIGRARAPGRRGITVCECVHRERCKVPQLEPSEAKSGHPQGKDARIPSSASRKAFRTLRSQYPGTAVCAFAEGQTS